MKRLFALVLLMVGFATSAHADYIPATWTDSATTIGSGVTVSPGSPWGFTFDLRRDGFDASTDSIDNASLWLNLKSNGGLAAVNLYPIITLGLNSPLVFDVSTDTDWLTFWLLGTVNSSGVLSITITSLVGNFNLFGATLTADGSSTSVPEPGALGLLGVGLLGMAVSMRRRKQAIR